MDTAAQRAALALVSERKPVFDEVETTSAEAVPLGDAACEWVVIHCPRWNDDDTENTVELVYGDASHVRIDLIPGNSSPVLPFKNLSEVRVRSLPEPAGGGATVLRVPFYYGPAQK